MVRVASQCKVKRRALVHCGLGPDAPTVAVDEALYKSEAHAGALVFRGAVQPRKDAEEPMSIAQVEAYAIVFDKVDGLVVSALATHLNQVKPNGPSSHHCPLLSCHAQPHACLV